MILLVVDTSGRNGCVALARAAEHCDAELIEVAALTGGTFSAQLVPQIAALLARHSLTKSDIGAFVVASGPGSFTGLRVGMAAVKALAEILGKPIAAVSLLQAVALASGAQGRVTSALDGGRGEVYAGEYEISDESALTLSERLLTKDEFRATANGTSVSTPEATLAEMARNAGLTVFSVAPPSCENIARLGWKKLQAGESVSPQELEANYVRRSDAEILAKISS